jgi:hypothetical protein
MPPPSLKAINPDGFKSSDRPGAKILHLGIGRGIARPDVGILPSQLNGASDGLPKPNRDIR